MREGTRWLQCSVSGATGSGGSFGGPDQSTSGEFHFALVHGSTVHRRDKVEHRSNNGAVPNPNDHRMWRLLLAKLHPDAGGDHELFVFASTVKDSVCGNEHLEDKLGDHARPGAEHPTIAYLRLWQTIMNHWTYAPSRAAHSRSNKC